MELIFEPERNHSSLEVLFLGNISFHFITIRLSERQKGESLKIQKRQVGIILLFFLFHSLDAPRPRSHSPRAIEFRIQSSFTDN